MEYWMHVNDKNHDKLIQWLQKMYVKYGTEVDKWILYGEYAKLDIQLLKHASFEYLHGLRLLQRFKIDDTIQYYIINENVINYEYPSK